MIDVKALIRQYRRQVAKRMAVLRPRFIPSLSHGPCYMVSGKIDGELWFLCHINGETWFESPSGRGMVGGQMVEKAAKCFGEADQILAGELYVPREEGRPRVHDVTRTLRSNRDALCFAIFDVVHGPETIPDFRKTEGITKAPAVFAQDQEGIAELFKNWVETDRFEGLVVTHMANGRRWKIKKELHIDAVVIGAGDTSLLLGLQRDGCYQVLTTVGRGKLSDAEWAGLLSQLQPAESEFHSAHKGRSLSMVRPELVVEIRVNDVIPELADGAPIMRTMLYYQDSAYRRVRMVPLVSPIHAVLMRVRPDKEGADITQVTRIVRIHEPKNGVFRPAQQIGREVYVKNTGMVRKWVTYETGHKPCRWVLCTTDYSPKRAKRLQTKIAVAGSLEGLGFLVDQWKSNNVKKGWCPRGTVPLPSRSTTGSSAPALVHLK